MSFQALPRRMQTECGLEAVDITDSKRTSNRILPTRLRGMICRLDALALGKPQTLAQCRLSGQHVERYRSWLAHPQRRMNRCGRPSQGFGASATATARSSSAWAHLKAAGRKTGRSFATCGDPRGRGSAAARHLTAAAEQLIHLAGMPQQASRSLFRQLAHAESSAPESPGARIPSKLGEEVKHAGAVVRILGGYFDRG
jgi:hypothetical protein